MKYLFIPYDPADSEVFEADTQRDMKRKWLELARGLRLVFSASDGEYSDFAGCLVGRLSFT